MRGKVRYEDYEKMYMANKSKRRKSNAKVGMIILILLGIAFGLISSIYLKDSLKLWATEKKVNYNEMGSIDYNVYLKDNNYLGEYLPKGMNYIASLIDTISMDFKYEMHATKELNYDYKYKITANLVITDKNNSPKPLHEKETILLKETTKQVTDEDFVIDENIIIDYDEYNNYVNTFKKDYALSANSNLIVTLDIITNANYDKSNDKLNTSNQLTITIPLSEQTIDITMDADELNKSGSLTGKDIVQITNQNWFVVGSIFGILSIAILSIAIYLYSRVINKKDAYNATIKKILKEYDRIIVDSVSISESECETVVRVNSIEELVDAHDTTHQPILFYEVVPNEKSYFIIIDDETIYKLVITRASFENK